MNMNVIDEMKKIEQEEKEAASNMNTKIINNADNGETEWVTIPGEICEVHDIRPHTSVKPSKTNTKRAVVSKKTKTRKDAEKKMKNDKITTDKYNFVEFSYSSKDGFERFEAVKTAKEIVHNAVKHTGGDMPKELMNAYEGLADVMEHIKDIELNVIRRGR